MAISARKLEVFDPVFNAISAWRFDEAFVTQVLVNDVPQRAKYENASIWAYLDDEKNIVGFGTLTICADYSSLTGGKYHLYIPLLAVHPDQRGKGFGRAIVEHLINQAICIRSSTLDLHDALFLDVYEDSVDARKLYQKNGFITLGEPQLDEANGKKYHIMATRIAP